MARGKTNEGTDTFDAGVFGSLRYDFKAFGGVQGIIPDPSDELIEQFMKGMRETAKEYQNGSVNVDDMSDEQVAELMEDDANMRIVDAQKAIATLTAQLCQESPNAEQLLALPFRVRQAFMRWLQGRLINPEADAAGSTNGRVTRIGG